MANDDPCANGHNMKTDWIEQDAKNGTTTVHRVCTVPSCGYTDTQGPFRA